MKRGRRKFAKRQSRRDRAWARIPFGMDYYCVAPFTYVPTIPDAMVLLLKQKLDGFCVPFTALLPMDSGQNYASAMLAHNWRY